MSKLSLFFYLLGGHALTDYVWQTHEMALFKNPTYLQSAADRHYGPWWWWMTAHALINGMVVGLLLHRPLLGLGETLIHGTLDTLKCLGKISTNQDQAGHLLSKVVWVLLT